MTTLFQGDTGTEMAVDVGLDITTATTLQLHVRKPDGSSLVWPAQASGTTALMYVTQTGDLDQSGVWRLQAYVEMPGWQGHGVPCEFRVSPAL